MRNDIFNANSYYEGLIQNFYGGAKGCFSAFMHFFYQYNQSMAYAQELAEMFKKLYETELENSSILSKILIKMGGDNKYYSCSRKFLSGYDVDYVKNFSQIFLTDIEILEVNIIELKGLILKIENNSIKDELKIILSNKKDSLKILKEIYFKNNLIN